LSAPSNVSGFVDNANTGKTLLSSSGFVPKADAFNIFLWGANSLTVFSALESNGFAYTLAEPSLTALSGQTATFLAGGELPIPLRTGSGSDSSISVTFKQFGIRLSMTPTVLDGNRLVVQLSPEVSEIDESLSITAGGLTLPGLRVRRTETTVATGDGETFVISGLVSQQTASAVDKFPILGDIPILGAFFRSNRFSRDDRELLMIVTPHLVRPFAKDAKLPALPGEEVKDYDPGYLRFLFLENGKFTQPDSGFSR
jgi:pilus assembly protein CpaC